jgi:hypothetical protein
MRAAAAPLPFRPGNHWSRLSFRFPQCESLRSVNIRSAFRFKARSTPMRACIKKLWPSAAPIRQPMPFLKVLIGLRQFHDVVGGIAQSQRFAPIR